VQTTQLTGELRQGDDGASGSALSHDVLLDAQNGFEKYLSAKGFPPRFIVDHAEDLMARARFELARAQKRGTVIENPPGWLINCAYRRAQNFVTSRERAPEFIELDSPGGVVIGDEATPEDSTLDRDRMRKVQMAVSKLSAEEKKIVALQFFEGMSLAKSARELGWDESKARRRHRAAMDHLYDLLGVDQADDLLIDIGFVCWASVAFGCSVPTGLWTGAEALADRVGHAAASGWARLHELVRRALSGGAAEPAGATAAGSVGRAAGVCGAALVCLTTAAGLGVLPAIHPFGEAHRGAGVERHPGAVAGQPGSPRAGGPSSVARPGNPGGGGRLTGSGATSAPVARMARSAKAHASEPPVAVGEVEAEHVFHSFESAGSGTPAAPSTTNGSEAPKTSGGSSSAQGQAQGTFRSFER
jgi:RNA polymerase sigma factor (sigma-70 family)